MITKAGHPRVMPPGNSWADAAADAPESVIPCTENQSDSQSAPLMAASSPSKSSPHGPQLSKCAAMPG